MPFRLSLGKCPAKEETLIAHQHDIGGLQGDCRAACAHRHADRGCRQRGGIVHAIADHRDDAMTVLEFTN